MSTSFTVFCFRSITCLRDNSLVERKPAQIIICITNYGLPCLHALFLTDWCWSITYYCPRDILLKILLLFYWFSVKDVSISVFQTLFLEKSDVYPPASATYIYIFFCVIIVCWYQNSTSQLGIDGTSVWRGYVQFF